MSEADAERGLRCSVAFVWLATGFFVLHPAYRAEGARWLAPLGLGSWVMVATCVAEVCLGIFLVLRRSTHWLAAVQTGAIVTFTGILAGLEPMLLVHPFGVLSKNLPLLAAIWAAWLLAREGWTPRATWLLRAGMAVVWLTEGLFPKLLFQQAEELSILQDWGLSAGDASTLVWLVGVGEALSGVAALLLQGRPLVLLLSAQLLALVVLPLVVTVHLPLMWVHPFGPLTKNIPILVGTFILARRCSCTPS